jgi:hypothetical protein
MRASASKSGPWKTDFDAMVRKTAVHRLRKMLPSSPVLDMAAGTAWTRHTDAKTYTTDAGVKTKAIVFKITPELALDVAGGFRYINLTTGASNDFERATQIARDMVMRYGMSLALGPMVYAENEGEVFLGRSVTKTTNMSEATMQKVDAEVRSIIDRQYALARQLIEDNQDKMHAMASALLEWETIDSDQLNDIMAGRTPSPHKDWVARTPPPSGGDGGGNAAATTKPAASTA